MTDFIEVSGTIKSFHGDGAHDGEEITLLLEERPFVHAMASADITGWAERFEGIVMDWHGQAEDALSKVEWELKRIEPEVIALTAPKVESYYDYQFALGAEHINVPVVARYLDLQIQAAHHRDIINRFNPFYWWIRGQNGLTDSDCDAYVEEFFVALHNDEELERKYFERFTRDDMTAHINDDTPQE